MTNPYNNVYSMYITEGDTTVVFLFVASLQCAMLTLWYCHGEFLNLCLVAIDMSIDACV